MNEKKWELIDRADVKVGDRVRLFQNGYTVDMKVAEMGTDPCRVIIRARECALGGIVVLKGAEVYRRRVPKPKLPTEPGSVIIATKVRGVKGRWSMMLTPFIVGDHSPWISESRIDDEMWHGPADIQEWVPAEVKEVV
jgi:hypothetical protein